MGFTYFFSSLFSNFFSSTNNLSTTKSDWVTRSAGSLITLLMSHERAGSVGGEGLQLMRVKLIWLLGN